MCLNKVLQNLSQREKNTRAHIREFVVLLKQNKIIYKLRKYVLCLLFLFFCFIGSGLGSRFMCADNSKYERSCPIWAGAPNNYCTRRYVRFMKGNCKKSCGLCGKGRNTCFIKFIIKVCVYVLCE